MSLSSKAVVITGGSSGIGAATAVILAKKGASVAIVGRHEEHLNMVAEKCSKVGKKALVIKADLTNDNEAANIIKQTIEKFGKLDILINCAGIFKYCPLLEEHFLENYHLLINTNLKPVVVLTKAAAPYLIETKGNIVSVSSILASMHLPGYSIYSAIKAAINQFSQIIANELADKGVRVNTISPGPVETNLFKNVGKDYTLDDLKKFTIMGKISQPEEIGELIAYMVSDKASSVTGSNFVIDCGSYVKN